jgi:hypothetical protein
MTQTALLILTFQLKHKAGFPNIIYYYLFLTANGFSPGGSSTTIGQNRQVTHITQNNNHSNKTQTQNTTIKNTLLLASTVHKFMSPYAPFTIMHFISDTSSDEKQQNRNKKD